MVITDHCAEIWDHLIQQIELGRWTRAASFLLQQKMSTQDTSDRVLKFAQEYLFELPI